MKLVHLPGPIDIHVHLRDPGETKKEDFYSGTSSALAGGITTVFDMPNNAIPVFSEKVLSEKLIIAQSKAVCDWGLYFGTDGNNISEFARVLDKVVALKIYLNLTTGNYLVSDEDKVRDIFKYWPKDKLIVVHAEYEKVDFALSLAAILGNKIHITHVANKIDLEKIIYAKRNKIRVTCDVTPHHLFLTNQDLETLGLYGHMKPSLKTQEDLEYLWNNLKWIDCIASDHAPHTLSEKQQVPIPSGVPGLETMLPLLLTAVKDDKLTLNDISRLTHNSPIKIFNLRLDNSSFTEVDLEEEYEIKNEFLKTKCKWSPYVGRIVKGKVKNVFLRGKKVYENGKILVPKGFGNCVN